MSNTKKQIYFSKFLSASRLALAFGIPLLVLYAVFSSISVLYKDSYTMLTSDLLGQYVNYYMYFRNALLNGSDLAYSFTGALGNDMTGIITYYILSPFNLLFLLYPAEEMTSAIYVIILCKIAFAGLTFNIFISKFLKDEHFFTLIFSSAYALSGFTFFAFFQLMWLDGLYMLPLIALGLVKLIREKKMSFYAISLGLALIFNYYIGFMLCIASVLFFFYMFITESQTKLRDIVKFAIGSLSAGALSMIAILTALYSTVLSSFSIRNAESVSQSGIIRNVSEVLSAFFTGTYFENDLADGEPQIYMGLIPVFFLILFFVQKRSRKQKISAAVILGFIVASFFLSPLNLFWYAFTQNHLFNYRYAFIFIFFALLFASSAYKNSCESEIVFPQFLVPTVICGIMFFFYFQNQVDIGAQNLLIFDGAVIGIILLTSFIKDPQGRLTNMTDILLIIQVVSLLLNGQVAVKAYPYDDGTQEWFYSELSSTTEIINQTDNGFYRTEKTSFNSYNDSMLASYNGLTHFSSSPNTDVQKLLGDLGYDQFYDVHVHYDQGAALAADSLFGIKYLIGLKDDNKALFDGYEKMGETSFYDIYKNSQALQIGTMISSDLSNVEPSLNPFDYQQRIYDALLGEHTDLFSKCELEDFSVTDIDNLHMASFQVTAKNENPICLFTHSNYYPSGEILVNDTFYSEYFTDVRHGIINLGQFKTGSTVSIKLTVNSDFPLDEIFVYSQNTENIQAVTQKLSENSWKVNNSSSSDFSATVTASDGKNVLFTTIPYSDRWDVNIDGTPANVRRVLGALMAVEIPDGTHTLSMKYKPGLLIPGFLLSFLGLLSIAGIIIWEIITGKNDKSESEEDYYVTDDNDSTVPNADEIIEPDTNNQDAPATGNIDEPDISEPEVEEPLTKVFNLSDSNIDDIEDEEKYNSVDVISISISTQMRPDTNEINTDTVDALIGLFLTYNPNASIIINSEVPDSFVEQMRHKYSCENIK